MMRIKDPYGAITEGHCAEDVVELCWPDSYVAVVTEEPIKALQGWRLIAANEAMVSRIEELVEQGVF